MGEGGYCGSPLRGRVLVVRAGVGCNVWDRASGGMTVEQNGNESRDPRYECYGHGSMEFSRGCDVV